MSPAATSSLTSCTTIHTCSELDHLDGDHDLAPQRPAHQDERHDQANHDATEDLDRLLHLRRARLRRIRIPSARNTHSHRSSITNNHRIPYDVLSVSVSSLRAPQRNMAMPIPPPPTTTSSIAQKIMQPA